MRAPKRLFFLALGVTLFVTVSELDGQVNGIPASVTSYNFGGNVSSHPGIPASVTSLGPRGFSVSPSVNGPRCFNTFFPGHQFSSSPRDQFGGLDFRSTRHHRHFGPLFMPAYSYAYPVAVPVVYGDDGEEDPYASEANLALERPRQRPQIDKADATTAKSDQAEPARIEDPVTAQPTTVLVFKDGHQIDVENYAIVGETLFEFAEGLTHKIQLAELDLPATQKANDDRGVEFRAPSPGGQ